MLQTKVTEVKDYIGFNATDVISYLNRTYAGKSNRRFFLLHGPPGCGKTTLVNVIEHSEGITMRRSNASDARNLSDIKIGNYITTGITNKRSAVILDECDGLEKKTWKRINEISKINNKIPIILIVNNRSKIPKEILKQCMEKEIKVNRFSLIAFARRESERDNLGLTERQINDYVDRCKSYRCLKTLLEFGYSDDMEEVKTQNQQILAAMHGTYTKFKTADLRSIIIIYYDNIKSIRDAELISQADIFLNKYEKGYNYGKNIVVACLNGIRNKKETLMYPRTYKLIYTARNKDKNIKNNKSSSKKRMPDIKIVGLK